MNRKAALFLVIVLLAHCSTYAQDLVSRIPHNAFAVVSIKTDHFFDLVDVTEFNTSTVGAKLLQAFEREGSVPLSSIEDIGIDIQSSIYYYTHQTDSIWYHTILLPLSDSQRFAAGFAGRTIRGDDGIYRLAADVTSDETTIQWDDRLAVISFGAVVDNFFADEAVAAQYGILQENYGDTYRYDDEAADAYVVPPYAEEEAVEMAVSPYDDEYGESDTAYWEAEADSIDYDAYWETDSLDSTADWDDGQWGATGIDRYDDSTYWNQYEATRLKKDSLGVAWVASYATDVLLDIPVQSVLTKGSFVKSIDRDALVTVWIDNVGLLYDQFFLSLLAGRYPATGPVGFGSLQAGIYANGDALSMKTSLELQGDLAQSYARIYTRKINRKFMRYLDSDSLMGFFAYSLDMKAYMEEFPKMSSKIYAPLVGEYGEELAIGAEVLSLLLDEEAIGNTVKGDVLFVLNGLTQHDIAYTDYEYDEDYNVTEVEKTKTETIPDFLVMFSSDNEALYRRLMDYTVHKGVGTLDNRVYALNHRELPTSLYVTYRDGIVFLGTAQEQLENIAANRNRRKASRFHRKLLRQNLTVGFLNTQRALERFSEEELSALEAHIRFKQLFGHLGNFYFRSGRIKKNVFTGELVAQTPEGFSNSLQYLLWLADYASEQP